jgi:hypothetical protein
MTPECEKLLLGLSLWEHASEALRAEACPHIDAGAREILRAEPKARAGMLLKLPVEIRPIVQDRVEDLAHMFLERAAIREYDGEMTREEAERLTRAEI